MIGDHDITSLQTSMSFFEVAEAFISQISSEFLTGGCFKHMKEVLCRLNFPQGDQNGNHVIHICKETCFIFLNSCQEIMNLIFYSYFKRVNLGIWRNNAHRKISDLVDCNYLPSVHDSIPCFYKPVMCDLPPNVTNARIINGSAHDGNYLAKVHVEYECLDETFQIEGNSTVTCLYSGLWSETPRCSSFPDSSSANPLLFVIPILIIPFCLWIVLRFLVWSRKGKTKKMMHLCVMILLMLSMLTNNY